MFLHGRPVRIGILAFSLLLNSCGGDGGTGPDPLDAVASVTVSPDVVTVDIGSTTTLQAMVRNGHGDVMPGAPVTWSSTDPQRASVQAGVVTGLAEGPVTIRASAGGKSGQAAVTVNDPTPPADPGDLQATSVSDTEIRLTWQDNSGNEDEFRIERESLGPAPASGPARVFQQVAVVGADATSYLDQGLTPGVRYRYRMKACNQNGCSQSTAAVEGDTYTTLTIQTALLPDGVLGVAYSHAFLASGGDGSVTWSVTGGSLPGGLSLSNGGTLDGTPTEAGTFPLTIQAEGAGQTPSVELDLTVHQPLAVTTTGLPDGQVSVAYAATLAATGGDGVYTWSVTAGVLPGGVTLDAATGALSGAPSAAGTFAITVQVQSGDGQAAAANLTLDVLPSPVEVTTTSLPDGSVGTAYSATLAAAGGDGTYTWSVTGSLPPGLTLDAGTGVLSGTPGAAGTFAFAVEASSAGLSDDQALTITVSTLPVVEVTTTSLVGATQGVAYSQGLSATGGDGTYTWTVTGSLPPGLTLDAGTGTISGTPNAAGTFAFTVLAHSAGLSDDQALSINVVAPPPVVVETVFLRGGYENAAYADGITASGGTGSYAFSVVAGGLPPGLGLNPSTGAITGTPSAGSAGAHYVTVQVTSGLSTASATYILTVSTAASGAFNMMAHTIATGIPSSAVRSALNWSLARWEQVVTGDLGDVLTNGFTSGFCQGYGPAFNGVNLDDIEILVRIENIDGPGDILGSAGPCAIRSGTTLALVGILTLDSSDLGGLDTTQLRALIFHEIGHIVGIGTLWNAFVKNPASTGDGSEDPRYTGPQGVAAYKNQLGGPDPDIPLANTGGSGTRNGHWRESTFNTEIMTGYSEAAGVPQPVSVMTIASLLDLGYVVNLGAADSYAIPAPPPPGAPAANARPALDDILRIPLAVVRPDGTVLSIPPPGGS